MTERDSKVISEIDAAFCSLCRQAGILDAEYFKLLGSVAGIILLVLLWVFVVFCCWVCSSASLAVFCLFSAAGESFGALCRTCGFQLQATWS